MEFDSRTPAAGQSTGRRRGRVVMLVCNGVRGDSRVQKTARSAAEAGWEVTLLGRSPDGRPASWRLGEARVRLLSVPTPLAHPPRASRRPLLTRPLAYRPGTAGYRLQRAKARRDELRTRRAALALGPAGTLARGRRAARLALPRLAARLAQHWAGLRKRQLDQGLARRGTGTRAERAAVALWQRTMKERCWRRLWPSLYDFELAYGRAVDELRPDLIHAHDFRMLGVGARAKIRAAARGETVKLVWDAHEFLPGVRPWTDDVRWLPAHLAHEREYVPYADAAVTVSATLAGLLRRTHHLAEDPHVVLNAPETPATRPVKTGGVPGLRALCGIGPGTPLVVYSGAAAPQRGLDTMVDALPGLPGVHTALVVPKPAAGYLGTLRARAARLGVAERLHVLPYVDCDQVVPFLAEADAGAIPLHHWPNHEIALITKFFEYAHARLPLVVSDVETMAATTRAAGIGEVFTAEDTDGYTRAVRAVLADPERYRAPYGRPGLLDRWTWEAQAQTLDRLYTGLLRQTALSHEGARTEPEARRGRARRGREGRHGSAAGHASAPGHGTAARRGSSDTERAPSPTQR
ncbi:glycosyltransferase family 4 protein [Streptomyces sp. PU-14G]|uniref:glycosyltransferase family 4 protein n=1 Tax=Streptomyces sp. PU-14G TaxID=2800808 RepID=UPI0034E04483